MFFLSSAQNKQQQKIENNISNILQTTTSRLAQYITPHET